MLRLLGTLTIVFALAACVTASDDRYVMPAEGRILPGEAGGGITIKTDGRTRVLATRTGRVLHAGGPRGNREVILDHGGGMRSRYTHLQRVSVARGDWVRSGKTVGWIGGKRDSSAELGFDLSLAKAKIDPVEVIEIPKMAALPKVKVSIQDSREDQLDALVDAVSSSSQGADRYGPKPSGKGLVIGDTVPQTKSSNAEPSEPPSQADKYGPLPAGGLGRP